MNEADIWRRCDPCKGPEAGRSYHISEEQKSQNAWDREEVTGDRAL